MDPGESVCRAEVRSISWESEVQKKPAKGMWREASYHADSVEKHGQKADNNGASERATNRGPNQSLEPIWPLWELT